MSNFSSRGYDVIGDIHGHAGALRRLLEKLGYVEKMGIYRHPTRTVVFVGDFIDRGPEQKSVLEIAWRLGNSQVQISDASFRAAAGNVREFVCQSYCKKDPTKLRSSVIHEIARKTSIAVVPSIQTILCREVWPRTIWIFPREQLSFVASSSTNAWLAAASTGGAVTLIFNSSPNASQISLVEARGCNFTAR